MAALEREVWRIDRAGSLDRLQPVTEELPPPGPGEVRVRVRAVGLNFADVFACLGLYSATPAGSFVPGLECAGEVEASGQVLPGRPGWRPGDRVVVLTRFGAYATHVNVDSRYLHALPADWTFAEGAAWPVQTLTAWYAIGPLAAVERGDLVLVHSAAGGVGLQAIALLDGLGARAVATVGSADKARFLARHAGIDPERVIVRDRRTFPAQLDRALASAGATGFDAVLDALMGPYFAPAHARLAPEGRHVVFGAAD
ncbi:MAG TPA: alcohol dehydrogenase catalytic domain-containing protein, partial [Steroidobacteraceae bacterium]|nr:alcohol dehydrogenase catalytic domain-containing protein [Steroidobacteraceae bacterium]